MYKVPSSIVKMEKLQSFLYVEDLNIPYSVIKLQVVSLN